MLNRIIKFRAWDKHEGVNHMLLHGSIENWLAHPEEYELMQYTGLKDKNGKEIYEGDIIQRTFKSTPKGKVHIVQTESVKWSDKNGWTLDNEYTLGIYGENYFDELEIIGNIYETKN